VSWSAAKVAIMVRRPGRATQEVRATIDDTRGSRSSRMRLGGGLIVRISFSRSDRSVAGARLARVKDSRAGCSHGTRLLSVRNGEAGLIVPSTGPRAECEGLFERRSGRKRPRFLAFALSVQRSSGASPVCFAISASILGPISTLSCHAKT